MIVCQIQNDNIKYKYHEELSRHILNAILILVI